MRSVGIATCSAVPDGDEDAGLLAAALAKYSIRPHWRAWDDPCVDWAGFALSVVRSTWDYPARRDEFLRWSASVPHLHNPPAVLGWNSDKTYLAELDAAGVPIVETRWLVPGESLPQRDGEFVVKPTVGAGSLGVGRFDGCRPASMAAARHHVQALHEQGRTVMVQPYLTGVDSHGETALIYLSGVFAHAIGKGAMLDAGAVNPIGDDPAGALWMPERITPRTPSAAELRLGAMVMANLSARFGELLYARVDLLPAEDGPVVIEVELVEPSLYLLHHAASADQLARAIAAQLDRCA